MNTYITRNPQVGSLVSACPQKDLLERKRLLLKLMAMRDAVRVICGPSLFGKTVLALQYAKIVFTDQSTLWVRADDLRFLRDLDSSSVTDAFSSVLKEGPACELLVFDNVPNLSFNHFRNFVQLIASLKALGCEVIITTRHCSLFLPQNTETYKVSHLSSCAVSCGDEGCNQLKPYELVGAEDDKYDLELQSKQDGSKERKNCNKGASKSKLGQDSSRVGETKTSDMGFDHVAASNTRLEASHKGDHKKNHKADQKKDHEANHEIDRKSVNLTFSFITAQDLLLNSREIAHVFPNETSSLLGWVRPAVLCDKKEGHKRFLYISSTWKFALWKIQFCYLL